MFGGVSVDKRVVMMQNLIFIDDYKNDVDNQKRDFPLYSYGQGQHHLTDEPLTPFPLDSVASNDLSSEIKVQQELENNYNLIED